ncbi:MAG: nicotinate-nucleotide--dimethylbenzimidazole phosphoribosyltransferase [Ponticaulis sp.]|nr:nicotinate-nucleotide--dimethylbenzimidazole phosphoribosyltransferase [Ponticaulis sp.]
MTGDTVSPLSDVYDLIRQQPVVNLPREYNSDGSVRMTKYGRLDRLGEWIAACQRRDVPKLEKATLALFAGSHGLAKYGVSVSHDNATQKRVEALRTGDSVTNGLAARNDTNLRIFELALEVPTKDISNEPAMTEQECASTIAFGMEAVTEEPDCIALGVLGVGGGTAAAAVACALYGGDAQYWVRAGQGVPEEVNLARAGVLYRAVQLHRGHMSDPLVALQRLGGRELAACVGAIIAARHQGIPVLLDGFATAVAAGVVHAIDPRGIDHVIAGQQTDRPAHKAILERLDLEPLIDLQLQQGEGIGGLLAIPLLKAACVISANNQARKTEG